MAVFLNALLPLLDCFEQTLLTIIVVFKDVFTISSNYLPISLTSVVGKMLEAIIARTVRKHLDNHKLIKHSQHGFSKGKSCLTNLLSFYRKVFETLDSGDRYDIIFVDFSKAFFDRVPHRRLISF